MRILILGGTGFLGPHEVRYALARGHEVTIFHRGTTQLPADIRGVEELRGDRARGDLGSIASGTWDVCIDNPASLPSWSRAAVASLASRVGSFIHVSTISVYADTSVPADESSEVARYEGANPYAETMETLRASIGSLYGPLKALCEREVLNGFAGRAAVVRPGLVVGPGDGTDRFTYWPLRLRAGGDVLAPGTWEDAVQFIDVRDLAEWIVRLAEDGAAGIYNAVGPAQPLTLGPFLTQLRELLNPQARFEWVPARFLSRLGVQPWTDLPAWLPGDGPTAGLMRTDIRRALAKGLTFRPLEATVRDTLAWFDALPPERRRTLRAGLTAEREREVLQAWRAELAAGSRSNPPDERNDPGT